MDCRLHACELQGRYFKTKIASNDANLTCQSLNKNKKNINALTNMEKPRKKPIKPELNKENLFFLTFL